jgi:periplasmic divalent cation tolerance protein
VSQREELTGAVMLIVTLPDRAAAEQIGEALVERRLAAGGSVVPMIHSFFYRDGKLQRQHEALLLIKTSSTKSAEAQAELQALLPREKAEVLEVRVSGGSAGYLEWLLEEVR